MSPVIHDEDDEVALKVSSKRERRYCFALHSDASVIREVRIPLLIFREATLLFGTKSCKMGYHYSHQMCLRRNWRTDVSVGGNIRLEGHHYIQTWGGIVSGWIGKAKSSWTYARTLTGKMCLSPLMLRVMDLSISSRFSVVRRSFKVANNLMSYSCWG